MSQPPDFSKIDWSQAVVCDAKCWQCQFAETDAEHPAAAHTWMDQDDIDCDPKVEMPKTPEDWAALAVSHPCGCWCMKRDKATS